MRGEWLRWLMDRLEHSHLWAFILALGACYQLVHIDPTGTGSALLDLMDLVTAAVLATWAHSVWHRAEHRRVARASRQRT